MVPRKTQCVGEMAFHPCWSAPGHHLNYSLHRYLKLECGALDFCFLQEAVVSVFFLRAVSASAKVCGPHHARSGGRGVMVSKDNWGDDEASWTRRALAWKAWLCRYRNSVWRLPRDAWVHPTAPSLY